MKSSPLLLILALWAAGLGAAAQFAKISLIFPELRQLYGDGAGLGLLLTLLSAVGLALGLAAGAVVARYGHRRLLLAALALGAACSAFQSALPPMPVMLASRLVEGVSHLAIVVAAPALIAHVSPDRFRNAAMALWGTFFAVAYAFVAWAGPPLIASHGANSAFIAHAAVMAALAGLLVLMLPRDAPAASSASGVSAAALLKAHATAYRSPAITAPALGWLFFTLSNVSLLTLLPPFLAAESRHWAASLMPLASVAASMTLGVMLLRTTSAVTVIMLGFAAAALAALIMWMWPDAPWPPILLFACFGLVQGASFAAVPALNAGARDRALAYGAMAQMGNLGNLTGAVLLLLMIEHFGFNGLITFTLMASLGGIMVHALMARRARIGTIRPP